MMANVITGLRILVSAVLLFCPVCGNVIHSMGEATIVVAIIYCTWLGKIKNEKPEDIG